MILRLGAIGKCVHLLGGCPQVQGLDEFVQKNGVEDFILAGARVQLPLGGCGQLGQ